MILASWNIRGFNMPLKHLRMQNFLRSRNVDVMAILESKLDTNSAKNILDWKFAGWNSVHNLDSHHAGRIILLLNDKVDLSVKYSTTQLIHCSIGCKISGKTFQASFVYGLHSIIARRSLWISLNHIGNSMDSPWLLLGDFNSILSPDDNSTVSFISSSKWCGLSNHF